MGARPGSTTVTPVRRRRSTELTLVVMAGLITAVAYTLASLGANAEIPARIGVFLVALLGLVGLAHVAVRVLAPGADGTLLPLAVILHGLGYVMISRLDDELAGLQTLWSVVAIVAFVATLIVVPRAADLARYKWTLFFGGAVLLMLPLVPGVGVTRNGARLWVELGPISFQPGEFAKLAFAIFFAAYLADRRELIAASTWRIGPVRLPDPAYIAPILVAWGFSVVVMIGQRDLGSSLLFFTLFVVMMWVATERIGYLVLGFVLFGVAAFGAWRMFDHVQTRVDIWLDPWADEYGRGFQIVQALYGIGDGGIAGTGLGRGSPDKVPLAENDFIFAAIGEELGLVGATAVLMAYLLLIGAGLRVALRTDRPFDKLLATGLTTIIGVQAFIIVGGVTKVVPLTGITLPFVSYGGSSLLSNYIALALLIRLSDSGARRLGELPDTPTPQERWAAWRLRRRGDAGPDPTDETTPLDIPEPEPTQAVPVDSIDATQHRDADAPAREAPATSRTEGAAEAKRRPVPTISTEAPATSRTEGAAEAQRRPFPTISTGTP